MKNTEMHYFTYKRMASSSNFRLYNKLGYFLKSDYTEFFLEHIKIMGPKQNVSPPVDSKCALK